MALPKKPQPKPPDSGGDAHKPYVAFKDDRYRYKALVAREVRITLVVALCVAGAVYAGATPMWAALGAALLKAVRT